MEDSKKAPSQPKDGSTPTDRIIELTPELEVISTSRGKIIDLTQVLSSPGGPVPAPPKPIVARTTASPFSAKISRHKGIESDVDAAFDLIQSKAEEARGPRVEPAPSEDDFKVEAPKPIGDWDDTIVDEPLILEEVGPGAEETPEPDLNLAEAPAEPETVPEIVPETFPETFMDHAEAPAEPEPASMTDEVPEATPATEEKISSLDELKADDTLELTDVVRPIDLTPSDEMEAAPAPAEEAHRPIQETVEILEEEPASLLDTAIEIDEAEEVLDLTEIASAEEMAAAGYSPPGAVAPARQAQEEEEEVLDLTEIASAEEMAAAGYSPPGAALPAVAAEKPEEEEEIIELVDRVELPPAVEETAARVTPPLSERTELAPEFETEAPAMADAADKDTEEMTREVFAEIQTPPETARPERDQVIRLDSVLSHVRKHQDRLSEEISLGIEEELAREPAPAGAKFPIGIAMEDVKEALGPLASPNESEIEAVIEKVIRSKYGQTIEQMIATVVEKVVTREMESIRRNLMEDQGEPDDD